MHYPLNVPGFAERRLTIALTSWLSSAELLIDGRPPLPSPGGAKGQLLLHRDDGSTTTAQVKQKNFLDPVPQVTIDNATYSAAPPFKWYEWLWLGLPVMLIAIGGAIGALCGVLAASVNGRIFRTVASPAQRYLLSGLVTAIASVCYLVLAIIFAVVIQLIFP